jgi:hypothetical protein
MLSSITNSYEQLVLDQLFGAASESFAEPPGQELLADIMCLALNQLPARYVRHSVDFSAHLSSDDSRALRARVATAIANAIATAKRRQAGER